VGQVIHQLPEGPSVHGVTSLAGEVFLLRRKERDQVEVYDGITYRLQRCLTVPNIRGFGDMTSCEHYLCVYISDHIVECIHRLDLHGASTHWPVNDRPHGLSVNRTHNLLVTFRDVCNIAEFSSHGDLIREITPLYDVITQPDVINPWHAIQLTSGQYIVCHGGRDDAVHGVCMISADGRQIVHSHGGQPGPDNDQYEVPRHLAVDAFDFVFVSDLNNSRVKLLSPTLGYIRDVVSNGLLKWKPGRLYLDTRRRHLYVTDNEWKGGKLTIGRVIVLSV